MRLEIKTADELRDPDLEARWAERREGPQAEVLRYILGAFAERGGPIPIGDIEAALAGRTAAQVRKGLATLDARDLILLEEGEVRLAYPFSATPTPFVVRFEDGRLVKWYVHGAHGTTTLADFNDRAAWLTRQPRADAGR